MNVLHRAAGVAVCVLFSAPFCGIAAAIAQTPPSPAPSQAERNAAIVRPLTEIGRVRAKTPYCAALARARPGIDAAIAYEFQAPVVAADLRNLRMDSDLSKYRSLKKLERDLASLWYFATAGRAEVLALRQAAYADGVDQQKRDEMLGLANAMDGAKERQKVLAKQVARTLGILSEKQVSNIANSSSDEQRAANPFNGSTWSPGAGRIQPAPEPSAAAVAFSTMTQQDAIEAHDRTQLLFQTFNGERLIREDLANASMHATAAMKLGGCEEP